MVDVIMCLLIFFMLAAKMVEQENSPIDLPVALAAMEAEKQTLGSRVVINIREVPAEQGGAVYLMAGEPVPIAEVLARLATEGRNNAAVNCVIRADRSVSYRFVEEILIGCAAAKIENITFSALRGEGAAG